ncbi:ROK family transcriptional regulator [Streptomyces thermodiastaticus]|uniref:ROK family transcriptional regulator n=1 Tax=Streptomyces thermodiastaticus TaxID=44061 RepID=UPI00167469AF|nr:ROK family transcriptional regulator [Streptomyces thermodiastaticus]MCE7553058.1 ROK family transcriptional regulator [Streptomyces thermodiastaticus]GHF91608.1 transcriptional regulator [Streptomyces thermodiastaticus]
MPASPSTARVINDRLALRLLQQRGPLTAGQLKQLTGLSRPTVADLVERLSAAGLITVVGESDQQRRGPNARLYGIAADRAQLAALDVRTDGVTVTVADLLGRELARAGAPIGTDTATGPAVEQAVALVEQAVRRGRAERLHTLTVGAPGLIDPATGELRDSTGLPVWHRRLVTVLQRRLPGTRVVVENETNLAALAEQRDGAARGRDTFVLLWLGGGTGAAVILDGTLRRGASGGAGEIGFLPVPGTPGLPSATDCEGGFHRLASAPAVVDLAAAHGIAGHGPGVPQARGAEGAADLVRRAARLAAGTATAVADGTAPGGLQEQAADTERAARFLDALADRIALGVASVAAVLDPGCVVLGGEIGQAGGDALAARVEQRVARLSPLRTEVRAGVLGGAAVLRGALLTARDSAQEDLVTPPGAVPDSPSGQGR